MEQPSEALAASNRGVAPSSSSSTTATTLTPISASGVVAAEQSVKVKPLQCITFCEDAFKTHETLCDITELTLDKLLAADPYLHDIAGDISHEEVLAQVNSCFLVIRL